MYIYYILLTSMVW